jgi:hypothetical protein
VISPVCSMISAVHFHVFCLTTTKPMLRRTALLGKCLRRVPTLDTESLSQLGMQHR